jgi:hypothetical protein
VRLIFSRKGFDSSAGGVASPILPSGQLLSLPIPEPASEDGRGRPYGKIQSGQLEVGSIVASLTKGQLGPESLAHLDPDLEAASMPRQLGWRPTFGQTGAAESHLRNQGVGSGDLFLFFGWFREVEKSAGLLRYRPGSPDRHLLFGWLQVGDRLPAGEGEKLPPWVASHPHAVAPYNRNDSLYVAADAVELGERRLRVPGGGIFRHYHPRLCLTAEGASRSVWSLPPWFYPEKHESSLSYHRSPERWSTAAGQTLLQTVGRGQEFVLDCRHYPQAPDWIEELLLTCAQVLD